MFRLQAVQRLSRLSQNIVRQRFGKCQGCLSVIPNRKYWNKDWAAKDYPETQEERDAAAIKYGILPEDYEPYPREDGFGDYPKLPLQGVDGRDPYEDWDMPSVRRNFGEPMHLHADILGEDRYYPDKRYAISLRSQFLVLATVMTTLVGLAIFAEDYKMPTCSLPKQLPYAHIVNGTEPEKHFSFEVVE